MTQKRLLFLSFFIIFLVLFLLIRLFWVQVIEGPRYKVLSDKNRIHTRRIIAPRGNIFDRNGILLAGNKPSYQSLIHLSYLNKNDREILLKKLVFYLNLSTEEYESIREKLSNHPRNVPFLIKKNLTWEQVCLLEARTWELKGLEVIENSGRIYPLSNAGSHVIGYLSSPTSSDASGKDGIEKAYDDYLKGEDGLRLLEVNAKGSAVRILKETAPIKGQDIHLTLDAHLQDFVYKTLSRYQSGGAVVLDVATGAVLALASFPGYDPNLLVKGISHEVWSLIKNNPYNPLVNKVTQGLYSPASLMKIVDDIVAFSQGPERVFCNGHIQVGRQKFHCWKKNGHQLVEKDQALAYSCDVYYYELAKKIGFRKLLSMAYKLGLGQKTHVDLPGEKPGLLPSMANSMSLGETILLFIGQGRILTTPLQWATMLLTVIKNGQKHKPFLWIAKENTQVELPMEATNQVKNNLIQVVENAKGTCYRLNALKKGLSFGAKTGTSQVRRVSTKERHSGIRSYSSLPWHLRDHSLFVGFSPSQNPKFVVAVIIEHGGWGSSAAAPVGRDILDYANQLFSEKKEHDSTQ